MTPSSTEPSASLNLDLLKWLLSLIPVGMLAVLAKYLYKKLRAVRHRHFPGELNIAISIKTLDNSKASPYSAQIRDNLLSGIQNIGLTELIKVKDFSDIFSFTTNEEAEKFGKENGIDIIVHGKFTQDSLKKDGEPIHEFKLSISYTHPDNQKRQINKILQQDFASRFAQRGFWRVREHSSFDDVKVISSNVFDLSLYVLGVILKLHGKVHKSCLIFEKLFRFPLNPQDFFQVGLIPHLVNCWDLIAKEQYAKKDYSAAKLYIEKIQQFLPDDISCMGMLALCEYHLGNKNTLSVAVNKMLRLNPKSTFVQVDVAFLRIIEGRYSDAFENYKKLSAVETSKLEFNPPEVIEFLDEQFEMLKEPAIKYATGIMLFHHLEDKVNAEKDLRVFVEMATDKKGYKKMLSAATTLLKKMGND